MGNFTQAGRLMSYVRDYCEDCVHYKANGGRCNIMHWHGRQSVNIVTDVNMFLNDIIPYNGQTNDRCMFHFPKGSSGFPPPQEPNVIEKIVEKQVFVPSKSDDVFTQDDYRTINEALKPYEENLLERLGKSMSKHDIRHFALKVADTGLLMEKIDNILFDKWGIDIEKEDETDNQDGEVQTDE